MTMGAGVYKLATAMILSVATVLTACSPATGGTPGGTAPNAPANPAQVVPQHPIVIVGRIDPPMLSDRIDRMGLGSPVTVTMAEKDDHDVVFPILVERLPSQSEGSWIVNADGTMRTTYTLRPNLT